MVRLAISVEGETEEIFVDKVIKPYLETKSIFATPILLTGDVAIPKIKRELNNLARSCDKVTTLYDFYGFRGKEPRETKESLEERILESVASTLRPKIIPYIQMYEYEGLLFTEPQAIENNIEAGLKVWAEKILAEFGGNPEAINDSEQTAPSKRLLAKTQYIKTVHGPNIAAEIGLRALRDKCSGFDGWLSKLEEL